MPLDSPSSRVGVGHDPDSIPSVGSANGGSRNAVPLSIVPERGQVSENVSKPPSKQSCDVFHDDECGSYLANEPGVFAPQAGSFAGKSRAFSSVGQVLTGEAATNDIGPRSHLGQPVSGQGLNVVMDQHPWPMLGQHLPAERIDFTERDGLKTARPLKPEAEAAEPGK